MDPRRRRILLWRWAKQDKTVFAHCSDASFLKAFCLKTYSFSFPLFSVFLLLNITPNFGTSRYISLATFVVSFLSVTISCTTSCVSGKTLKELLDIYCTQCLACGAIHLFQFFSGTSCRKRLLVPMYSTDQMRYLYITVVTAAHFYTDQNMTTRTQK